MSLLHATHIPNHLKHPTLEVRLATGPVLFQATQRQVLALVYADAVVGITSGKGDLRYVRLTVGAREARQIAGITRASHGQNLPVADDNRTVYKDGRTYRHHAAHCSAFAPNASMAPVCQYSV